MNTQEHLTAIRAKCVELLETAKLRTPGTWSKQSNHLWDVLVNKDNQQIACVAVSNRSANACFLASCAGPSEAGWTATIAAIDFILRGNTTTKFGFTRSEQIAANQIIDAWSEELLK